MSKTKLVLTFLAVIFVISRVGLAKDDKLDQNEVKLMKMLSENALACGVGMSDADQNQLRKLPSASDGTLYYKNGKQAGSKGYNWYYPNGRLAGSKGYNWYYPNGKLAGSVGYNWYHANGRLAGSKGYNWYYPNGRLAGSEGYNWYYANGKLAGTLSFDSTAEILSFISGSDSN